MSKISTLRRKQSSVFALSKIVGQGHNPTIATSIRGQEKMTQRTTRYVKYLQLTSLSWSRREPEKKARKKAPPYLCRPWVPSQTVAGVQEAPEGGPKEVLAVWPPGKSSSSFSCV